MILKNLFGFESTKETDASTKSNMANAASEEAKAAASRDAAKANAEEAASEVAEGEATDKNTADIIENIAAEKAKKDASIKATGENVAEATGEVAENGSKSFTKLLASIDPILFALGALTAALVGIAVYLGTRFSRAVDNASKSLSEYKDASSKLEDLKNQADSTKSSLEEMAGKYDIELDGSETVNEIIDKLNGVETISLTDESDLANLKAQNQELERQINLQEKVTESAQKKSEEDAKKVLGYNATKDLTKKKYNPLNAAGGEEVAWDRNGNPIAPESSMTYEETDIRTATKNEIARMEEINAEKIKLNKKYKKALTDEKRKEVQIQIDALDAEYEETQKAVEENIKTLDSIKDNFKDATDVEGKAIYKDINTIIDSFNNIDLSSIEKSKKAIDSFFDGSTGRNYIKQDLIDIAKSGDITEEALNRLGLSLEDMGLSGEEGLSILNRYFKDLTRSIKEANEEADKFEPPTVDDVEKAFESTNQGANYDSMAEKLASAKELVKKGLYGTDDVKTMTQWILPEKIDDDSFGSKAYMDAWKEAYGKVKNWFNTDNPMKGMWSFLGDLKKKNSALFETFDKKNGKVVFSDEFESSAQAAKELGVNVSVVDTMLHKLEEYGFTFDEKFKFSGEMLDEYKTALSGIQKIYDSTNDEELKARLGVIIDEESKKDLETNLDELTDDQIIEIQFKYDLAQLDQKIAELKAAAAGEGYGNTTSNADLLATNEVRSRKWEEKNTEASQDTEYIKLGNKVSRLQSNMVGKDEDTRAKIQRDILAIQEFRTAYQNAFDSGDAVNWEDFLNSNSVKDVLSKVKEEFNLTEEEIEKILGRQLPDVEVNTELNDDDVQKKLKDLAEGKVVTYVTFEANVDDYKETVKAFNDENGTVHYTSETEDGKTQELSQVKSVKDGKEVVSYTAEIDSSNIEEKIKELENGTTINFLANIDGVEQRVQAVMNEDGIITYTANIDGAEQKVAEITHQDGTVEYSTEINSENIEEKIKELENGSTIEFTADVDGVEKQFEVLKDEDGTITYTLKAEDEITATAEYAWSVLTQIPDEVWTYLYSDDQASDDVVAFIAKTTGIPESTLTKLNAEDGASGILAYVISQIAGVPAEKVTSLMATDNATGIVELVSSSIGSIPFDHNIILKAQDKAKPIIDTVNKEVESIPRNPKITFGGSIGATLSSTFSKITNKIREIKNAANGGSNLEGTAHFHGTAYAKGTTPIDAFTNPKYRTSKSEVALTGEEGPELVVHGNSWWTVGDSGAEFTSIPKGSLVFNAAQTEELFENGFTNSRGKAYLSGTAYESGGYLKSGGGSSSNKKKKSSSSKKTSSNSSNKSSSNSDNSDEIRDWIEIYLSRQERITERLVNAIEDGVGLLSKQTATNKAIAQTQAEIVANQKSAKRYEQQANSVGLAEAYKKKVQNGTIDIQTIKDEKLRQKIEDYQNWYEKMLSCEDKIEDLKDQLKELAQTKFDNVTTEFENQISLIEHEKNLLESSIDLIESKGYLVSQSFYNDLIKRETENSNKLQSEYTNLVSTRDNLVKDGLIKKYSNEWYEMTQSINEVSEAILESKAATVEYQNAIRDLQWDIFDKTQDMLSQIQEESDFLIDLMSNNNMYDKDTAKITDQGQATLGLHAINYNAYMRQADEYAKEIQNLDKQLAKDPYNQDLLERRQELLKAQRDNIKSAEDEKQSIKDLVSDGYDVFLDVMQKAIDKRKELLNNMKDLYDYEKNISEQTKEISQLEKQLNAYGRDTSEESRATIQQLKVSLEEAKQNLKETEYDQYISDQEKMLDTLYDETEEWINNRLDNIELIIKEVIDSTNENTEAIKETLNKEANAVGITLSNEMNTIWSPGGKYASVVAEYQSNFTSLLTTTNNTLNNIKDYILKLVKDSDAKAAAQKKENSSITSTSSSTKTPTSSTSSSTTKATSNNKSTSSSNTSTTSSNSSSKWGSWFIKKKNNYSKSKLKKTMNTSIFDRLAYFDFDNSFSARAKYYKAMGKTDKYTGSSKQNKWMISEMKKHGFAKGGTIGDLIKQTGEDGFVLARTGEEILSLDKIKEMQNTFAMMDNISKNLVKVPQTNYSRNNGNIKNDIVLNLKLPNVHNVDDFVTELRDNKRFEKVVQQITLGSVMGNNSLTKFKY